MSCKFVQKVLHTGTVCVLSVVFLLLSANSTPAQNTVIYNVGNSQAYTSLDDLRNKAGGYLGWNEAANVEVILHNNDNSLTNYAIPIFNSYDNIQHSVLIKSNDNNVRTISGTNVYSFDLRQAGNIYTGYSYLILDKSIQISGAGTGANGGGIQVSRGVLEANGVTFSKNVHRYDGMNYGSGGAVLIYNYNGLTEQKLVAERALFVDNEADYGGAIYAENTDLYLKGTNFQNNTATYYGGAILFENYSGNEHTIQLGAFENQNVVFEGNTAWGQANSIMFWGSGSNINVNVDVGASGTFDMKDPMSLFSGSSTNLNFEKTGTGLWILQGNNDLSQNSGTTKFVAKEGTFRLTGGASLLLGNSGSDSQMTVTSGAKLQSGLRDSGSTAANLISVQSFSVEKGATLELNENLTLNIHGGQTNNNNISGTITGDGNLTKTGNGTLALSGSNGSFRGIFDIQNGEVAVNSDTPFTTAGTVIFGSDATLTVSGNNIDTPAIKARDFMIDQNATIQVDGYLEYGDAIVVLEADNGISGMFGTIISAGSMVKYLETDCYKNDTGTQLLLENKLSWNLGNDQAHGTFDIDPSTGPNYFTVNTSLLQKQENAQWDGKTLTKEGTGTLELAAENAYGDTHLIDGTLRLTHSKATDANSTVLFDRQINQNTGNFTNPVLELSFADSIIGDFYRYDTKLDTTETNTGKLLKTGEGVILLTNTENNYGDTEIKEGYLAVENETVLGDGQILFTGGALQYRGTPTGTLTKELVGVNGADIWLDAQKDVRITSKMSDTTVPGGSDRSGFVKTGQATLYLNGTASYQGDTVVQEGTVVLEHIDSIGQGSLKIVDGAIFRNTNGVPEIKNDVVIMPGSNGRVLKGSMIDTQSDLALLGDVSGSGLLLKQGEHTLRLHGDNSGHVGETQIDAGVVEIYNSSNLGKGTLTFNGGALQTMTKEDDFVQSIALNNSIAVSMDKNANIETQRDLILNGSISGNGGLIKTGDASLTLNGTNYYTGHTRVESGKLIVDGKIYSQTHVAEGATLRGSGTIADDVHFENGSAYEWYCGYTIAESSGLSVLGDVYLDGTVFRPVTAGGDTSYFVDPVDGRTVLTYRSLAGDGQFNSIDHRYSPFYNFELDYSTPGQVKVIATQRNMSRGLSDSVATGLNMSQRRAHRRPFDRIDDSFRAGRNNLEPIRGLLRRTPALPQQVIQQRGQTGSCRNVWGDIYGRTTEFESTYHDKNWRLNSFGFQAGYSFVATPDLDWGVTAGVELPELSGYRDEINMTDGFLGLYYGRRIQRSWELKGYLGGGTQRYRQKRFDALYRYDSKYYGESFQTNIELARPLQTRFFMLKPFIGFDLEYASQEASRENRPGQSQEYRTYSKASLTQLFVRVGFDIERCTRYGDAYFGIAYANMIAGDSTPSVGIYYPTMQMNGKVYGANLGQNVFTFRVGGNIYLNQPGNRTIFWNFTADTYADRAGGQAEFSGGAGYSYRF